MANVAAMLLGGATFVLLGFGNYRKSGERSWLPFAYIGGAIIVLGFIALIFH